MKKSVFYALFFALVLGATSCENEGEPNPYDVVVDSTVNAKLSEHRLKLAARNDSILNALEIARADSLSKISVQHKNDTARKDQRPNLK